MENTANNMPTKVETNNVDRSSRKSGKEEKKRKDDKNVDQVMKGLNNLESPEEKLAAMCKKYADVMDENRKLQLTSKQLEKGLTVIQREKEQLQTDHSKAILTRSRLESLCRELQKQNKAVKEESLLKVREEEEKRKEVSAKFNATLSEITTLMSSSNEKTNKLRDENVDITNKFRSICEQSGLQQQQVDKMNMQRKLEGELNEAKLTKQKLEFSAEKEALLRDKQQLLMDLQEARTRVNDAHTNEMNLKAQVQLYADRYEEFQNALTRSNEVFGGFKGEMDKMSKKIGKLEKEAVSWKTRWEKSHQALLEMATEKQQRDGELAHVNRQLGQLQKLCRTLQTERSGFLAQIKSLGTGSSDSGDVASNDLGVSEVTGDDNGADVLQNSNNLAETPVATVTEVVGCPKECSTETSSNVEETKTEPLPSVEEIKVAKAGSTKAQKKSKLTEVPVESSKTPVPIVGSCEPVKCTEPSVKDVPNEPILATNQEIKVPKATKSNKKSKPLANAPKPKEEPTIEKPVRKEEAVSTTVLPNVTKEIEKVTEIEQTKGEDVMVCSSFVMVEAEREVPEPVRKEEDVVKVDDIPSEPPAKSKAELDAKPISIAQPSGEELSATQTKSVPEVSPVKPDKVVSNEIKKGKEGAKKRKK